MHVVSVSIHPGIRNEVLPSRENIDKGQSFLDYNRGGAVRGSPIISDRDGWGPRGSDNSPPPKRSLMHHSRSRELCVVHWAKEGSPPRSLENASAQISSQRRECIFTGRADFL